MEGFDYSQGQKIDLPLSQWQQRVRSVVAQGGWRRVEDGETFAKDSTGNIQFEVYGYVPK